MVGTGSSNDDDVVGTISWIKKLSGFVFSGKIPLLGFFVVVLVLGCHSYRDSFRSIAIVPPSTTSNCSKKVEEVIELTRDAQLRGIDPVYLELYEEAKRRSDRDYRTSHARGRRGIVIGPTEGDFKRYTYTALKNGRRIRHIIDNARQQAQEGEDTANVTAKKENGLKLALMTSSDHIQILKTKCEGESIDGQLAGEPEYMADACRLWLNGTLFDDIIATPDEPPYRYNDNNTLLEQGSSRYWLKALGGYLNAPYRHSLFLDSDSFPCPGIDNLFLLTRHPEKGQAPGSEKDYGRHWQLQSSSPGDLAVGIEQYSNWQNHLWIPGDPAYLKDSLSFAERNTGAVLFSFERQVSHTLAHYIPLVSEHVYTSVGTPEQKVPNDQVSFRMALYLFHKLVPEFVEHQIPMHASCRTYPGKDFAGTDGFLNGMYPVVHPEEEDAKKKYCKECACTPCLVNHNARIWDVGLNSWGQMGWEADFHW